MQPLRVKDLKRIIETLPESMEIGVASMYGEVNELLIAKVIRLEKNEHGIWEDIPSKPRKVDLDNHAVLILSMYPEIGDE